MAKTKQDTTQMTLPEITAEKQRLADESAALELKLATIEIDALEGLQQSVADHNAAFDTRFELAEPILKRTRTASGEPRKCRTCGGPPHRKKNCPGPTPIDNASGAAA